jgi:hypothetical protein
MKTGMKIGNYFLSSPDHGRTFISYIWEKGEGKLWERGVILLFPLPRMFSSPEI